MSTVTVTDTDKATWPPVGSWAWGNQGIAYQVTARHRRERQIWLTLATDRGPVELPLARVVSWAESPPSPEPTDFNSAPQIEIQPHQFQPGDRVRYVGKCPSLLQVTRIRAFVEVLAINENIAQFRHPDWLVTRECPVTDLQLIRDNP